MDLPETISLLRHAHDEVVTLRRRVADLEPKAHAYDTMAIIARQSVRPESQAYGIDVVWRLKEAVEKLDAERKGAGEDTQWVEHPPEPAA
jgi:hypothetical protein